MKAFKTISVLFLSFLLFTVTSCENEPLDGALSGVEGGNPNTGGGSGSGSGGGNSGGGNSGGTSSGDYWPMAVGNNWNYNYLIDGVAQEDSDMEMSALEDYEGAPSYKMDSFFSNQTSTDGSTTADLNITTYARKDNGDYLIFVAPSTIELQGTYEVTQSAYDYIILKDYVEVGATWNTNYNIISSYTPLMAGIPEIPDTSLAVSATFEILEKDASVSVNGETYSPVIKVKQFNTYTFPGVPDSTVEIMMYFAKDVGLIKSLSTAYDGDDNVTAVSETLLSSYMLN